MMKCEWCETPHYLTQSGAAKVGGKPFCSVRCRKRYFDSVAATFHNGVQDETPDDTAGDMFRHFDKRLG